METHGLVMASIVRKWVRVGNRAQRSFRVWGNQILCVSFQCEFVLLWNFLQGGRERQKDFFFLNDKSELYTFTKHAFMIYLKQLKAGITLDTKCLVLSVIFCLALNSLKCSVQRVKRRFRDARTVFTLSGHNTRLN